MRVPKSLLLLPLLAACAEPGEEPRSPFSIFTPPGAGAEVEEPQPDPLPPSVQAALPPGVPASVVLQDAAGCYLYSVEVTNPPSGFPLRDGAGNPICEGADGSVLAAAVPPAAITPAAAIAPTPVTTSPITSAPIGSSALPDESPETAPTTAPTTIPPAAGPLVPPTGSITPPAPLAPLN